MVFAFDDANVGIFSHISLTLTIILENKTYLCIKKLIYEGRFADF